MKDYDYKVLKKKLDEEGNVAMKEGPNFYTNPAKKGHMRANPGHLLTKNDYEWKADEYNRKR